MRVLYYDCFSGISGDMNLGALVDLGVEEGYLKSELSKLGIDEAFELVVKPGIKNCISGTKVDVLVTGDPERDRHFHAHDHQCHGHHHHHGRNFKGIREMIESSDLCKSVKKLSVDIFYEVAVAEAKVHGKSVDEVHFHEVGAVDSIVDVVGAAVCIDALNVDKIMASPVQLGGGFVMCDHGRIPVPSPATTEILRGVPVQTGLVQFETTTPTGAAILKASVDEYTDRHSIVIEKTGYGLGTRTFEVPNVLRVYHGEVDEKATVPKDLYTTEYEQMKRATQFMMETNIDDMSAELYGYVEEKLFENGVLDVYKTPIIMKKGLPAVKLSLLIRDEDREKILDVLFKDTTSGGVREYPVTKHMMKKQYRKVDTKFGTIQVKDYYHNDECCRSKPEYEECVKTAEAYKVSIREVYDAVWRAENERKKR